MMRLPIRRLLLAVLAVAAIGSPAFAQDFRGSVIGTVTDATGAVLPGVTVTVTNTETGVSQPVVTDSKGVYQVLYLNPGTYSVTAELQGFKKIVRAANQVRVGDALRVDVVLQPGGVTETVDVWRLYVRVGLSPPARLVSSGVSVRLASRLK